MVRAHGSGPFKSLGLWAVGSLHSTATLSIQSAPAACMCLGACTVPIFSCPTTTTRLVSENIALTIFFGVIPNVHQFTSFSGLSRQF
ncbi:hypothetical protein MSAN_01620300 [Mycena sanguinolenta]|uniref:Uncharacterized protein n=1 Tax=Mycena sanguinolenta TaxID=230812 RepID=A0A8H6Y2G2_9AGAR|nr:hypothetical protein MSAN_01620300 [Mycena sanguinolenta]